MGVILAVAVALDALVVRLVLLPIVLRLGRHYSWHLPAWLGRLLPRVRFSH
jgi:RND superfamily putative drug exporter